MKKLAVFILVLVFAANTVAVSTWAAMPMAMDGMAMTTGAEAKAEAEAPCPYHQPEQQPVSQDDTLQGHCEGLCLCLHASYSPFFINHPVSVAFPVPDRKSRWLVTQESVRSYIPSLLKRPPKHLS